MKKNKKILVSGGAGFIGSHICEKLVLKGNKVYCIDNLSIGSLEGIANFSSLSYLNCSGNLLTSLDPVVGKLS